MSRGVRSGSVELARHCNVCGRIRPGSFSVERLFDRIRATTHGPMYDTDLQLCFWPSYTAPIRR